MQRHLSAGITLGILALSASAFEGQRETVPSSTVDYDVLYVRSPRFGDHVLSHWNDTADPWTPDRGAQLVRWRHRTGEHEVLFPLPEHIDFIDGSSIEVGSVADPSVSYDGSEVVFAYFHDASESANDRLSPQGADVYRLHLETGALQRLTHQEFTPNTGHGAAFSGNGGSAFGSNPRVGVFNTGPAWLPDPEGGEDRIVFTSTRNNFMSAQQGPMQRASELFTMDGDGRNVERIAAFNLGRALHPYVLSDGRILFTSWENQGMRDQKQFALWEIRGDGTDWMSFSGAFEKTMGHHFTTETSGGAVVTTVYYNFNNNGFGELVSFPARPQGQRFWNAEGKPFGERAGIPFDPVGAKRLTPFTTKADLPAPLLADGSYAGKFTHPSAAPGDDLLVVWTPGPALHRNVVLVPTYDGGIYLMPDSDVIGHPEELVSVFPNDPRFNEHTPRAVVPYRRIHGIEKPRVAPLHENDGAQHPALPPNTPFALLGASSVTWRETKPQGPDPFNQPLVGYRWLHQGTDTSLYEDDNIFALRLLAFEQDTDLSMSHGYYPEYWSYGRQRTRILGEIPLRREQDPADTSFLVKIPADTPFTFQALDEAGRTLFASQTWHSLRPGEMRTCGGCHAHSLDPVPFDETLAGAASYAPVDLARSTPWLEIDEASGRPRFVQRPERSVSVEYLRDVRPILREKCAPCHNPEPPAPLDFERVKRLRFDADPELFYHGWRKWPGTYFRLARDSASLFGIPAVNPYMGWFLPQATRYVRPFQSRQSLLAWKLYGERLDGRTNAERPTEAVPGDAVTLPPGTGWRSVDLDYGGPPMPPHWSGVEQLTEAERLTIVRWIDLGMPIHLRPQHPDHGRGYFADDLRPVLSLAPSVGAARKGPVSEISVGAYDLESGLRRHSLSVTLDVAVGGVAPGENLAQGHVIRNGEIRSIALPAPIDLARRRATLTVRVTDRAGHVSELVRSYRR